MENREEHEALVPNSRFDLYLTAQFSELTRSYAQRLIQQGYARLNKKQVKPSHKVEAGMHISIAFPENKEKTDLCAEDIPLTILHEDESILVIDKPVGLVVHPAYGNRTGTLVNAIMHHCRKEIAQGTLSIGGEQRPGIVHRIDKNTSGVLVVAKTDLAHAALASQFHSRSTSRTYLALCWGSLPARGVWEEPIGRDRSYRQRMGVRKDGKKAHTSFERKEHFGVASLFAAQLKTGRTHQIRVHASHYGHPLVGDSSYYSSTRKARKQAHSAGQYIGKRCPDLALLIEKEEENGRQLLHAHSLGFEHPTAKTPCAFSAPPPAAFQAIVDRFRFLKENGCL